MYKLAVFDVDGTLVSKEDRILLNSTIETLMKLKHKGVKIAIASGRPLFAMEQSLLKKIAFDYYICSNGMCVADGKHQVLFQQAISKEEVEQLTQDFHKFDDAIMFQFDDKAYVYHGRKRISNMMLHSLGRLDILEDARSTRKRHDVSLPYAAVSYIAKSHLPFYENKYPQYSFLPFMDEYYDIFKKGCSKASGIQHLCDIIDITMDNVICFGDALNDYEMIQQCGCGVAMGDALEEIQEVANYITSKSDEDGIYQACKHFDLI